MTETAVAPEVTIPPGVGHGRLGETLEALARAIIPVVLALLVGGLLLLALGRNPLTFYGGIVRTGLLSPIGLQDSVTRMAPLLLIAVGLIVVFRANIWNIGIDGQFLLGAAMAAGFGPPLARAVPPGLALVLLCLIGAVVGAAWTLIPAFLKARYAVNEVITTLMMTFIGINLANLLVKGLFRSTKTLVPQTDVLPFGSMLPYVPGTRIHVGIVVAVVAVLAVHYVMTRTSFGIRLDVLGANPRAAVHLGLAVRRLTVISFVLSGALIGLAGAVEILGVWGYVRADWNPAFGLKVVPLIFLARLNALASVPFVAFFAVISIGGDYATRQAGLPTDFLLVLVGLVLIFMAVTEYLRARQALARGRPSLGLAPTRQGGSE